MVIRNDRPQAPKQPPPTTTTPKAPDVADGMQTGTDGSTIIAGTDGIEGVEEMSSIAGPSQTEVSLDRAEAAKKTEKTSKALPTHNPEAVAKVADQGAVAKLINDAAQNLKPGESVTLGGKAGGGEGLMIEAGLQISVTKRPDGKLDVKTTEEAAIGVGGQIGAGDKKADAKAMIGVAREVTFTVSTGAEAAALMAKFAAAKAAQSQPVIGVVAEKVYEYATKDQVSERKFALTFEAEAEVKGAALGLGITLGDSAALVESPPGTWFVEIAGEVEVEGRAESDMNSLDGLGGKGNATATIRIPIAAPDVDVGTPQGMLKHAQGALKRIAEAEVTLEMRGDVDKGVGGGAVVATKTVKAKELPGAVIATDGWAVRGEATIGPREASVTIGAGEVEVTANRSVILYRSPEGGGGNVKDQMEKATDTLKQAAQVKNRMIGGN